MASEITPEQRRLYNDRWKDRHPEAAKESHRKAQLKWRANNRAHVKVVKQAWDAANRPKVNAYRRAQYYKSRYGLTVAERDAMILAQGSRCKTCGGDSPGNKLGWVVDHCHSTDKIRGILCHDCNLALGHVKDDVAILESLIKHLKEFQ
jgi:hypothetical protein